MGLAIFWLKVVPVTQREASGDSCANMMSKHSEAKQSYQCLVGNLTNRSMGFLRIDSPI